ncbi:MAG: response regulator [Planctomycetota bacterium]
MSPVIEPGQSLHRYSLRLGNRNYPFMKLVLQEHLVPGEYYFCVDTHDQMEIKPELPDYEAFVQVRRFNSKLKKDVEQGFEQDGLPTLASVRRKQEVFHPDAARHSRGALILVVDDELEEARALEHFLRLQGFDVARAQNGREALERLEVLDPVLIVLDYEMPEMDGLSLIRELRARKRTRKLPVLLTSACQMLSPDKSPADCFLAKPYATQDLLRLVDRMIG